MKSVVSNTLWTLSLAAVLATSSASAGDLQRFPDYGTAASSDAELEELKDLLRQAYQLREEQMREQASRSGESATDAAEARPEKPAPRARASRSITRHAKPAPGEQDTAKPQAGDDAQEALHAVADAPDAIDPTQPAADAEREAAPAPVAAQARAGCMYRNDRLIWEKVPGTCQP